MQGRYDLVIERDGEVAIVDFKTGDVRDEKAAEKRASESLQLDIYALAHLETKGRLPDRVELRFLESGLVAGRRPTPEEAAATRGADPRRRGGDPPAGVPAQADLHGVRPVPLPRHLPPHGVGPGTTRRRRATAGRFAPGLARSLGAPVSERKRARADGAAG